MITIDLALPGKAGLGNAEFAALNRLLDRCEQENIRDVVLRLPAVSIENNLGALRPVAARRLRFSAWFRTIPSQPVAGLFIAAGHRVTFSTTLTQDAAALRAVIQHPAYAAGAPWQVNLFLAVPAPNPNLIEALTELKPRAQTRLTLAMSWQNPEAGPAPMASQDERAWSEILLAMADWWTSHGVTAHFACGLPLCLFSTQELGRLALLKIVFPLAVCTPSLIVRLDRHARACPLLPAEGWVPMPEDLSLTDAGRQLIGPAGFFAPFCDRPDERSCRTWATGACGGGCMAHNAARWQHAELPKGTIGRTVAPGQQRKEAADVDTR